MNKNYHSEDTDKECFTTIPVNSANFTAVKQKRSKSGLVVGFLSLLLLFFFGNDLSAQNTVVLTGTGVGSWTVPCGVTSITVQVWGPGGKGGNVSGANKYGGGGGGGGYSSDTFAVTPEQVIGFTIGAGSSTTNTTILTLTGGYGLAGIADTGVKGAGGTASGGTTNINGDSGTAATSNLSGIGGNSPSGGMGGAGRSSDGNGNGGGSQGGGGGGAYNGNGKNSFGGGDGGDGQINITYTSSVIMYCVPNFTTTKPICNVTFAGINNTTSNVIGGSSYENFCSTAVVLQGSATNSISIKGNTNGNFIDKVRVYIDWDQNGIFGNGPNEIYDIGSIVNSTGIDGITLTGNIAAPATAKIGTTRMRVMKHYNTDPSGPCQTGAGSGQTEDYFVNVVAATPCVTPIAQPTVLSLTPTGNTIGGSFNLASPTVDNYLVVVNTTGVVPTPVNGTAYTVGSTALGESNVVADIDNNTTFTATGFIGTTLYYVYVFSYNSFCSGGPLYLLTSPLYGNTTTLVPSYCTPSGSLACNGGYTINNVTINTLNNTTECSAGGYTNYAATGAQTTSVLKGSSYNLSLTVGSGSGTHSAAVWMDFNQNGLFTDAGEYFLISNTVRANSTTNVLIPIPVSARSGNTRMRVRYSNIGTVSSTTSCLIEGTYGETEDYTITFVTPSICVTPTAQPTVLNLTPSGTSVEGSFIVASPATDNYLVVMNTTGTPPTLVDRTTYTIGGTVGSGNVIVNTENENTFTATGLTPNTKYYFFVYSYNSVCTGGPLYNTSSPLTEITTTTAFSFCPPTSNMSTLYINSVQTVGNLTNMANLMTNRATNGYGDFTALPATTQIPGGGINLDITLATSRQYLRAWVDWNNDGTLTNSGTELVYTSGGVLSIATSFGFVVPLETTPGNYRLRIRSYAASPTFTPCGNLANGETEDYLITVVADCPAIISSVTDNSRCEMGTVNLVATASGSPTQFRWYDARTGGSLVGNSPTGSWTTPSISKTTNYYVTAFNGTCESLIRTKIIAKVNSSSIINVTPSTPAVCGEGNIVTITAAGDNMVYDLLHENFQGGLGSLSAVIIGGAGDASTQWQSRTSTYVPGLSVWKPAISSRSVDDKFAFCTSDKNLLVNTSLESANFSTTAYSDLTLTFRQYYSYYGVPTDYAYVEVSTNDGGSWTAVQKYVEDHAIATDFEDVTIDLTSYINNANFRIRFRYNAQFCDGWAIDDVRLFGTKPMNTTFSWGSGTVAAFIDLECTKPYNNQSVSTVYIKPTSEQLSVPSWSFTATATLSNGCTVEKLITIYNKTKQWLGTTPDWNDANNWKPVGVPDLTNCVFIPMTTIIPGSNYNAYAKNLTIKSTGSLELPSTSNLTVTDFVNVDTGGIFNIRDQASLIQKNDVTNTGNVNVERITPALSKLDFTYWSSPVSGFKLGQFSTANSYMYSWLQTALNITGNWQPENDAAFMTPGKGYIIRTPWGHSDNTAYLAKFSGTPNNGNITIPIYKGAITGTSSTSTADGTDEDDEWNLIGNPYPSGLSIAKFIDLPANANIIDGTVYIWTHNSQPSVAAPDPFYGDYVLNYTSEDYATVNKTGATVTLSTATTGARFPSGYIAAGQSFFIKAANTMPNGTTANATFNNDMRETGQNSSFFKLANITKKESVLQTGPELEMDRIWLNLANNSGAFSQTLIGYVENATQGLDRGFDGELLGGNDVSFYSIIPQGQLAIQGRGLPFDENDQIILGYNAAITGNLSIRIDHLEGVFRTQNIYLEDRELGALYDLKEKPYVFNTNIGEFNNRFSLHFTDRTLAVKDPVYGSSIQVDFLRSTSMLNIANSSTSNTISSVTLYTISGKSIFEWDVSEEEQGNIKIPIQNIASGVYIVKLKTFMGVVSKKIIVP